MNRSEHHFRLFHLTRPQGRYLAGSYEGGRKGGGRNKRRKEFKITYCVRVRSSSSIPVSDHITIRSGSVQRSLVSSPSCSSKSNTSLYCARPPQSDSHTLSQSRFGTVKPSPAFPSVCSQPLNQTPTRYGLASVTDGHFANFATQQDFNKKKDGSC